jgi:alcohol dehydrogenase class IV
MNQQAERELRKFVAPEFLYGVGALNQTGRYARSFGAEKVFVVSDPGVAEAGWLDAVLRSLDEVGLAHEVFLDLSSNPKDHEVAAGVSRYLGAGCDVIVAVGGGSPMDCAKGIGVASANQMDVLEFEGVDEVPAPGPPLICVPTTAGSSADVSQFAIITDSTRHRKIAIISKTVVPDVSLIDPETTTTMSAELTAVTGLDAFAHAVEAYASNASSPITDLHALASIPLITEHLAGAAKRPKDMESREGMMRGSLLAGLAFSNASLGLTHAMAHSLGGLLGAAHGMCNALLLEQVIAFNYPAVPDRYDRIAIAMGVDTADKGIDDRKQALLSAVASLRASVGITSTLGDLGVRASDIPQLAANAMDDPCLATNPRTATAEEVEELYERAS